MANTCPQCESNGRWQTGDGVHHYYICDNGHEWRMPAEETRQARKRGEEPPREMKANGRWTRSS